MGEKLCVPLDDPAEFDLLNALELTAEQMRKAYRVNDTPRIVVARWKRGTVISEEEIAAAEAIGWQFDFVDDWTEANDTSA